MKKILMALFLILFSHISQAQTVHTIVDQDSTQTLTNKTLTAPIITNPAFSGTSTGSITIPNLTSPSLTSTGTFTTNDIMTKGPWVDVRTFGAKGDGAFGVPASVDSTSAFTQAIATGLNVYVPPGIYDITSITLTKNGQTLFGEGLTSSMVRSTSASGNAIIIGNSNQIIKNLYLSNANSNPSRTTVGISATAYGFNLYNVFIDQFYNGINVSSSLSADVLYIENFLNVGIYLNGAQTGFITNFFIAGGVNALRLDSNAQQITFSQGLISNTSSHAIALLPGHYNIITNTVIKSAGGIGIYLDSGSSSNDILNNFIWQSHGAGVESDGSLLTRIENNSIFDNQGTPTQTYGVVLGTTSKGAIVNGNILSPNLTSAYLNNGTNNLIYGNSENNNSTLTPINDIMNMIGTYQFAKQIISTLATGIAPFSVASTTPVANLDVYANNVTGTATNDNAAAGQIGESYTDSIASPGSSITSATNTTITSRTLSAGDWEVWGTCNFAPAITTTVAWVGCGMNTSAAMPANGEYSYFQSAFTTGGIENITSARRIIKLATATTVTLIGNISFGVSTATVYGTANYRRIR